MSRYPGKKLPPHWVYVPSLAQLRRLSRESATDLRIELGGTGRGLRSTGLILLGWHERRVVDGRWRFYLQLWGVPESDLRDQREAIGQEAIRVIQRSVSDCLASPPKEITLATQMLLYLRVDPDGVSIDHKIEPVDRYSFTAGAWWITHDLA